MAIQYLNTDLDLKAAADLTRLAAALETRGVHVLNVWRNVDGLWWATLETDEQHDEPEANIAAMLRAIESLAEPERNEWRSCAHRGVNIGYRCGDEPTWFCHELSAGLVRRLAAAEMGLGITLYPPGPRDEPA